MLKVICVNQHLTHKYQIHRIKFIYLIDLLESDVNIERMKNDIITNVKVKMKEAKKYYKQFEKYNHLWLIDKNEYLNEFLTYGRLLTVQEKAQLLTNDPPNIRHQAPDMTAFSNQVK